MTTEDNEAIVQILGQDDTLAKELKALNEELSCLSHREMIRKEEIRILCEGIGKERLELFMERRKIYGKYEG